MAKRYKMERAGRLVRCTCYTMSLPMDSTAARAEKSKLSSAARSKMNLKTSWEKCRLTMAANFRKDDLFVTLTYTDDNLPENRKEAVVLLTKWISDMRREYRRIGAGKLRYIYTTEIGHSKGRWHHHIVMNRVENARELIQAMWPFGDSDVAFVQENQLSDLAKYFTKEAADGGRKLGQRAWTPSKGLRKPEVKTDFVPDNFTLSLPAGCEMVENPSFRNVYGEFSYMEYLLPPSN